MWNPWRGCHRYSEGCKYCYIHKGDAKRGMDTNNIVKSKNFDAPIVKNKNGEYKMKSGKLVYVCFSSDFPAGQFRLSVVRSLHPDLF